MSSSVPLLPPHPDSVLNPFYDYGSLFTPRALELATIPPSMRVRLISMGNQAVRSGTVSYSPLKLLDGSDGRGVFNNLWNVIKFSDPKRGCLFFDSAGHTTPPGNPVRIGIGNGTNLVFQLGIPYANVPAGLWYQHKISHPIHNWAAPLTVDLGGIRYNLQNTVVIYVDGVDKAGHWTCDNETGLVTLDAAPAPGKFVTADFSWVTPIWLPDAQPEFAPRAGGLWDLKDLRIQEIPMF